MGTVGSVERKWALPDLSEVATMDPVSAFARFNEFAGRALSPTYMEELKTAMHDVAAAAALAATEATGTKPEGRRKPPKPSKADELGKVHEVRIEMGQHIARLYSTHAPTIERDIARRITDRIAPLLPAIRAYVGQRPQDAMTAARLAWMIDDIRHWHRHVTRPERKGEPPTDPLILVAYTHLAHWRTLYTRLLEIAQQLSAAPGRTASNAQAAPGSSGGRITWKGQPAELYVLFDELVGKGWVELPKNRGKRSRSALARIIHAMFQFTEGTELNESTAVNYLKKGSDGYNEQRPEPRVPFTLKRNPDVGEDYDPDKAG